MQAYRTVSVNGLKLRAFGGALRASSVAVFFNHETAMEKVVWFGNIVRLLRISLRETDGHPARELPVAVVQWRKNTHDAGQVDGATGLAVVDSATDSSNYLRGLPCAERDTVIALRRVAGLVSFCKLGNRTLVVKIHTP